MVKATRDWGGLLHRAASQGVLPLVYWNLNRAAAGDIPPPVWSYLQNHFYANAAHNLILTGELLGLLRRCASHGIQAVPFKGPVLAGDVYENPALRVFADLDILVRAADVAKVRELLRSAGFQPEFDLQTARETAFLRYAAELQFLDPIRGRLVDVHWKIAPRYFALALDPASVFQRLRPVVLAGEQVWSLSSEDLLLVLCAHGAKHCWGRLAWICDVAALLSMERVWNWDGVIEHARALGCVRMLYLGLRLARDLLGAELPARVLQGLEADAVVSSLAARAQQHLFGVESPRDGAWRGATSQLDACIFHLQARERIRDRLRYCIDVALTPTTDDWMRLPLPTSLGFMHYILRPVRLTAKFGTAVAQRALTPGSGRTA